MPHRLLILALFVPSITHSVERVIFTEGDVKTTIDRQCVGGMMYTVARSRNTNKNRSSSAAAAAISIVQSRNWQGNLIRCREPLKSPK